MFISCAFLLPFFFLHRHEPLFLFSARPFLVFGHHLLFLPRSFSFSSVIAAAIAAATGQSLPSSAQFHQQQSQQGRTDDDDQAAADNDDDMEGVEEGAVLDEKLKLAAASSAAPPPRSGLTGSEDQTVAEVLLVLPRHLQPSRLSITKMMMSTLSSSLLPQWFICNALPVSFCCLSVDLSSCYSIFPEAGRSYVATPANRGLCMLHSFSFTLSLFSSGFFSLSLPLAFLCFVRCLDGADIKYVCLFCFSCSSWRISYHSGEASS